MGTLFIDYQEGDRKFTLRKTARNGDGAMTSLHLMVLTGNLKTSLAEAYEYAKENGLDFYHKDSNCNYPADLDELFANKKNKRSAKKQALLDRQAAIDKARQDRRSASEEQLENGIFPFGKHLGAKIESQPGYANWLVEKKAEFEKGSLLVYAAEVIERKFSHLLTKNQPPVYKSGHRKEPCKARIQVKGTVVRAMSFSGEYGTTCMIFIKDQDGLCIVAKGVFWADEGTEVDISGTIKSKDVYKGQDQTVINRVK